MSVRWKADIAASVDMYNASLLSHQLGAIGGLDRLATV